MSKIILTSSDELQTLIMDSVNACLKFHKTEQKESHTEHSENEFLDVNKTCDFLGIARPTLYSKVSKRELTSYKRGGKLYFKKSELLKWIQSGRRTPISELQSKARTFNKAA